MPHRTDAEGVLRAVRDLATGRPGTVWVGIDGFGASGKSTLAATLATAIPRVHVVHVDDFSGPGVAEWDWVRFRAQVSDPLHAGHPARYQLRHWTGRHDEAWREIPPGAVVVVEGVSSTRAEVGLDWDLTVWVDAPRELRLARALARDGAAAMPRWLTDWLPSEQAYAAREHPDLRADLLVSAAGDEPGKPGTLERL